MKLDVPEEFLNRLVERINDDDFCYFCDEHPSHGHVEGCPMTELCPTPEEDEEDES